MKGEEVKCPFLFCGRLVEKTETKPRPTLKTHNMPKGGVCPASLMYYPPSTTELVVLSGQVAAMRARIEAERNIKPDKHSTTDNKSYPAGRPVDPNVNKDEWQLGGREDAEIIPQGQEKTGKIPAGVYGQELGVASIPETASMANNARMSLEEATAMYTAAMTKARDAQQDIQAAQLKMQDAMHTLNVINGTGSVGRIVTALNLVANAAGFGEVSNDLFMQSDDNLGKGYSAQKRAIQTLSEFIEGLFQ